MRKFLFDTNLLSELRKGQRCDPAVRFWMKTLQSSQIYLSVITMGEIRYGIESLKQRDRVQATHLERWFLDICKNYEDRIFPVTSETADFWGKLNCIRRIPTSDALIAASALEHDCTVATRNVRDFKGLGLRLFDPFD